MLRLGLGLVFGSFKGMFGVVLLWALLLGFLEHGQCDLLLAVDLLQQSVGSDLVFGPVGFVGEVGEGEGELGVRYFFQGSQFHVLERVVFFGDEGVLWQHAVGQVDCSFAELEGDEMPENEGALRLH